MSAKSVQEEYEKLAIKARDLFLAGNTQDAIETYSIMLNIPEISDETKTMLYSNRSLAYYKLGDVNSLQLALDDVQSAINLCPGFWKPYHTAGLIYMQAGKWCPAQKALKHALKLNENSTSTREKLQIVNQKICEDCKKKLQIQNKETDVDELMKALSIKVGEDANSAAAKSGEAAQKETKPGTVLYGQQFLEERKKMLGDPIIVEVEKRFPHTTVKVGQHSVAPIFQPFFGGIPQVQNLTAQEFFRYKRQCFYGNRNPHLIPHTTFETQLARPVGGQQENHDYEETLEEMKERLHRLQNGPSSSTSNFGEQIAALKAVISYREHVISQNHAPNSNVSQDDAIGKKPAVVPDGTDEDYSLTMDQLRNQICELENEPAANTHQYLEYLKAELAFREYMTSHTTQANETNITDQHGDGEPLLGTGVDGGDATTETSKRKKNTRKPLKSKVFSIDDLKDHRIPAYKRYRLMKLLNAGYKLNKVASMLQISQFGARYIRERIAETGTFQNRKTPKRVFLDAQASNYIVKRLTSHRFTKTKDLYDRLRARGHDNLSLSQLRYRIKALGFRFKKMKKVQVISPKNRQNRLNARAFWESENYNFKKYLFVDECTIVLGRQQQFCWVRAGEKVPCRGIVRHGSGLHVFAGISYRGATDIIIWNSKHRMNSSFYSTHSLTQVVNKSRHLFKNGDFELVQDNHRAHISKYTQEELEKLQIKTFVWPPQSPDWNPSESAWRDLKTEVLEKSPKSLDELREVIINFWKTRVTPKYCRILIRNAINNIKKSVDGLNHEKDTPTETVYQK